MCCSCIINKREKENEKKNLIGLLALAVILCFASLAQAYDPRGKAVPEPDMLVLLSSALAGITAAYGKFRSY